MDSRITTLETMLQQDSRNSFVHYSLAMEYAKAGRLEDAVAAFRQLIAVDENYAAAYYHGGQTLERLGDVDAAREMYEKGIEVTTKNRRRAHAERVAGRARYPSHLAAVLL